MAYEVREVHPKPLFTMHVMESDGRPAQLRVHSGEAVIEPVDAQDWSDSVDKLIGFFLPDAEPPDQRAPTPILAGEAYLCGVVVDTRTQRRVGHGVSDVFAEYRGDAEGESQLPLLYLGFRCFTHQTMRIGYRVTVLQPLPD